MHTRFLRVCLIVLCLVAQTACFFPVAAPRALGGNGETSATTNSVPPLSGRIAFSRGYGTQADLEDVAVGATVSLINTGTNQTDATSVTDEKGRFVLSFGSKFKPERTALYYLEASKGLGGNLPGNNAARVRTLVKFSGGWTSLTNATPGGGIVLDPVTTAVSIGAALRNGNPARFDFATLIGAVTPGLPSRYAPVSGLSEADCTAILVLVEQALGLDRDPTAGVALELDEWVEATQNNARLFVSALTPSSGSVNTDVTVTGTGFSPTPSNNVLRFNGTPAGVVASSATSMRTSVPAGATSGQTSVQVGARLQLGPIFSVEVRPASFIPTSGSAGTVVTITGTGFDTGILANNAVTFSGVAATVTSATATSLTATVPTAAVSGPIAVSVNGNAQTIDGNFTVPVSVASFAPASGGPGQTVVLTGAGFSSTPADNLVTFNGVAATVVSATPTSLQVQVPVGATSGPVSVMVKGQRGTTAASFLVGAALRANAVIQTIAGSSPLAPPPGVKALDWSLPPLDGKMACDAAGNFYFIGNARVWKVTTSGTLSLVAGGGATLGDGGPATNALLNNPKGLALDAAGALYIADTGHNRIRKVSGGLITTVAGGGSGFGDGGPATAALLSNPNGIALDAEGTLYIADTNNSRIRKVSDGIISTIAGNGNFGATGDGGPPANAVLGYPFGVAVDATGAIYVADTYNNRIRKISSGVITTVAGGGSGLGDGGPATGAQLAFPQAIEVDAAGAFYVADTNNSRIRKVSGGIITTVAGGGSASDDGGPATGAQLSSPHGIALDATGTLYLVDSNRKRIRKVVAGTITTAAGNGFASFAGDGGPATAALFSAPYSVAVDPQGTVYVAELQNNRVRMIREGIVTTVAGGGSATGDGGPATEALLNGPFGVALGPDGSLYISEAYGNKVRKVTTGIITTVAGGGGTLGDDGPAINAKLAMPAGLAVDASGSLYVADTGQHRIRKVSGGIITTVAGGGSILGDEGPATSAKLNSPYGVALDAVGNLYIADTSHSRIRKVSTGIITTVAGGGSTLGDGGPGTSAQVLTPYSVAVDPLGTLYIADTSNYRIRKLSSGTITTVAGSGAPGPTGDGGLATSAQFFPVGLAVDSAGSLYIADGQAGRIRKVY
ncbi:IPT/TIG domain-containing protein [bacterium]|nr:IPT/TIG domain-containing protein [bacterium]